ncbi:hypothetical protein [Saccharopolyspora phatthalungensis]|uniref:Cellulose biosynthesis protein BcsQ n=1 Tax=Saccharopolyspora phatthalungensis TaxID=664693 RepID=A0A840QFI2_9PSEU|nr:hypothetical protein [Saccharopolyspora phatthalungensis]MBB5157478.1 hypothetical protein [Saccharopolyspora phatthalungensis]
MTTAIAGLASTWPSPVLVVDADPSGGDLVPGWLGSWSANGWIQPDKGVVSFARATRQLVSVPSEGFAGHVQPVPGIGHARLLAGVTSRAQAAAIGDDGWHRIASAARDLTRDDGPDVLIDAGRWVPGTPWPLITEADLVLLTVRPSLRHVQAALPIARTLHETVPPDRLGLAVCATAHRSAHFVARVLGSPLVLELPDEPDGARVFSEGARRHHDPEQCQLHQATHKAARRFHTWLSPHARHNSPDRGPLSILRSQGGAA